MMGLPDFTGATGGLLATMWIVGVTVGWGLCVRIRVEPMRKDLDEARTELRVFLAAARQKLLGGS